MTLAVLRHVSGPSRNARRHALDHLGRYFESVVAQGAGSPPLPGPGESPLELAGRGLPPLAHETIGSFLRDAELLGQRTAEMHKALASDRDDPAFAPEPFSALYQRALLQSRRVLTREGLQLLRRRLRDLPEAARPEAQRLLSLEAEIMRRFRSVFQRKVRAERIRCHGDFRLERLLYTGKDFLVRDFEGDPARPIGERRLKRSPLRDVTSMIRSFHHAGTQALSGRMGAAGVREEDLPVLEPWGRFWQTWVSAAFLEAYLATAAGAPFLPASRRSVRARRSWAWWQRSRESRPPSGRREGGDRQPLRRVGGLMAIASRSAAGCAYRTTGRAERPPGRPSPAATASAPGRG
jgi:maltose alpha-D-glucosyltransferase/alpha-amylase